MKVILIIFFLGVLLVAITGTTGYPEALNVFGAFLLASLMLYGIFWLLNTFAGRWLGESYRFEASALRIPILPFYSVTIPYSQITDVTQHGLAMLNLRNVFLSTDIHRSVLIKKKSGFNYVLSPSDPKKFMQQLREKMDGSAITADGTTQ